MSAGRTVNSSSQDWCTPPKYVNAIQEMFPDLDLDPCSNNESLIKAKYNYKLPFNDGLIQRWNMGTIFVNPPYGRDKKRNTSIKNWLERCHEAHRLFNSEILALIPVATNTSHWKKYVFPSANSICFLEDTRLKFYINGSTDNKGAPMACCMVYWGNDFNKFCNIFMKFGSIVNLNS